MRDVKLAEATRERVLAVGPGALGYTTDPVASALRTGRTGQIAVWVHNLLSAHQARVVHHLEAHLAIRQSFSGGQASIPADELGRTERVHR